MGADPWVIHTRRSSTAKSVSPLLDCNLEMVQVEDAVVSTVNWTTALPGEVRTIREVVTPAGELLAVVCVGTSVEAIDVLPSYRKRSAPRKS